MTLGRPTPNVSSSALYQLNKDTHVRLKVKFGAAEQLASLGVGHVVTQNVTSFAGLELNSEEGVQFRVKCAFILTIFVPFISCFVSIVLFLLCFYLVLCIFIPVFPLVPSCSHHPFPLSPFPLIHVARVTRGSFTLSVPILLSEDILPSAVAVGAAVPLSLLYLFKKFVIDPYNRGVARAYVNVHVVICADVSNDVELVSS